MAYNEHVVPGLFEIFCGPMYSGKTNFLTLRLMPLEHAKVKFTFIRPSLDRRQDRRAPYPTVLVDKKTPEGILGVVSAEDRLVAIDEIQFFTDGIVGVVEKLLREDKNVVVAGLDLNFRGEPYGEMGRLLAMAHEVTKCNSAVCKYNNCGSIATRTQRLFMGKPADYNSEVDSVEGDDPNTTYEPRCIKHHFIDKV